MGFMPFIVYISEHEAADTILEDRDIREAYEALENSVPSHDPDEECECDMEAA